MRTFIAIRCPNRPKGGSFECRHLLGGVPEDVIKDSSEGYEDVRYCASCGTMWHIKIEGGGIPAFNMLPKEERLDFKDMVDTFGVVSVNGNRRKM